MLRGVLILFCVCSIVIAGSFGTGWPADPTIVSAWEPTPSTAPAGVSLMRDQDGNAFKPGQVVVKFKHSLSVASKDSALGNVQGQAVAYNGTLERHLISIPAGTELSALDQLRNNPLVESVGLNYVCSVLETPNDTRLAEQWALERIGAYEAWDITTGLTDPKITIAIVDTGISKVHPDLAGKVVGGVRILDEVAYEDDWGDDNWHGTHVAGIAAAVTNNGKGIAGVSWGG